MNEKDEDVDVVSLPPGLYERLLTYSVQQRSADGRSEYKELADEDYPLLSRHLAGVLERALRAPGMKLARQVELCNRLLAEIAQASPTSAILPDDCVITPAEMLTAIRPPLGGLARSGAVVRPETPLSDDALFVNAPHEPALARELRTEVLSADRIDLLCAFIVWTGIRTVLDELKFVRQRNVPVRVITTTYTGITDPKALDELSRIGAEVKVSYDTRMTRLHAKAWLFGRESGFSTAYIGSSNLTRSALHEGLEWNVRLSEVRSSGLLDRFRATFDSYWADTRFVPYDRQQFVSAIEHERMRGTIDFTPFDIVLYEYQRAMLNTLTVERERHNRWKNLVVAATGTGKTVVAAFDFRRTSEAWRGASLLFVAHRREILEQSRTIFRHVLRNGSFGEILGGGHRPIEGRHVFASVQSMANISLEDIKPDAYDVIVIDEFHHAEAATYARLLEHFRPRLLIGLTATPERADSKDILRWFDGHIAVELRLWEALDEGLLCPFQYFGVADEVDLRQLEWKRSGYDVGSLSTLYTGNDIRTNKILQAINDIVSEPSRMRALGFCASVEHARYMAESFKRAGFPSHAITGETHSDDRSRIVAELRAGKIQAIFTVDVFNEGIDIPEVDTILLLRPTESATVFLQQLGRGLRLSEGKSGLTVLDFIGQQRREFRFDQRFEALTGTTRAHLPFAVEHDFPYLPVGCYIHLDRVARDIVLANIKGALRSRRDLLIQQLHEIGDVSLGEFLRLTGRQLEEIYPKKKPGWINLRRDAGLSAAPSVEGDVQLVAAIGRMLHIDDDERLLKYRRWLLADSPPELDTLSSREIRLLTMLHLDLWTREVAPISLQASLARLWQHDAIRQELNDVLDALAERAMALVLGEAMGVEPLGVHARYTRDEVLAALGHATSDRPPTSREGVAWVKEASIDALFVTLRKSDKHFSPTTMYRDYAISQSEFHWESQSTTSVRSPTGQRYIYHDKLGSRVLIFAREEAGERAFLFLGPAHYVRHSGDRPIAITWRLDWEIPPMFFVQARAVS